MVFGGGAPSFGNARRKKASASLSFVAPGTAAFGGSWSHTQMVQESMLEKRGRIVEAP
jgi:chromate transport protein ChrA